MFNCSRSTSLCFQTKCFATKCLWPDTVQNLMQQIYIMRSFYVYQFSKYWKSIKIILSQLFAIYTTYFKRMNIPFDTKQHILILMIRECMYYKQWSIGIHETLILDTVMIVKYILVPTI